MTEVTVKMKQTVFLCFCPFLTLMLCLWDGVLLRTAASFYTIRFQAITFASEEKLDVLMQIICNGGFLSISKRMLREPYIVDEKCVFGAEILFPIKTCTIEYLSLHEWKIPNFSNPQSIWSSEEFTVGGFKWKMKLFPKGNANGGKSISIYLEFVDQKSLASHEKVKAVFCIRLRNKESHAHHSKHTSHCFTSSTEGDWGFTDFIPIGDMGKGFLVNDCCFLETEISVQDVVFTPK